MKSSYILASCALICFFILLITETVLALASKKEFSIFERILFVIGFISFVSSMIVSLIGY